MRSCRETKWREIEEEVGIGEGIGNYGIERFGVGNFGV